MHISMSGGNFFSEVNKSPLAPVISQKNTLDVNNQPIENSHELIEPPPQQNNDVKPPKAVDSVIPQKLQKLSNQQQSVQSRQDQLLEEEQIIERELSQLQKQELEINRKRFQLQSQVIGNSVNLQV